MHRLTKAEPGKDHTYYYDDAYRLTQSVPTPLDPASNDMRAEGFTFDLFAANHRTTGPDSIETYTYGQDNQLTSLALATPLTSAEDYTYTYDYENRLTGVVKVANGVTTTVTFKYDPFGRRIQKRVQTTQNGQNVVNVFIYVYDKEDVILERESTTIGGGPPTVTVKKYVHGPGVDEPLAVAKGNSVYYYHADGVGSIVALTNNTEATVEGYTYETFGKFQRFGNAVMNTYGFTGREYDAETGLYYYRARYYDPETGRFISKDPIGFAGGDANQYNYVLGDPVNFVDPLGLAGLNGLYAEYLVLRNANYNRNIYNQSVSFIYADKNWDDSVSPYYHQQGRGNQGNVKYVSPDGHSEAIFTRNGRLVTDPLNMGTYNYEDPLNMLDHIFQDIIPYYIWGNSPNDPTRWYERILGTYSGSSCGN